MFKKMNFRKIVSYIMILFLLLSIIPIVYCGFFDYANGDDLLGAVAAHTALKQGKGFFGYFAAVIEATRQNFLLWDGNFASTFVWYAFEPSIFGERWYAIVPVLGYFFVGFCTGCFIHYFLKKYLKFDKYVILMVCSVTLFFIFHYSPYITSLLFWWTGMVSYIFPLGLSWIAFILMDKYLSLQRSRYIVFLSLIMIFVSGAGYFSIILDIEVFIILFLYQSFVKKSLFVKWRALLIPFSILVIGFGVSFFAPGNSARAASEGTDIGMSFGKIVQTVVQCIITGNKEGLHRFISIRPLFLFVLVLCVLGIRFIDVSDLKFEFRYPIGIAILIDLMYCSVYAPKIFAGVETSGGVYDVIFIYFLLSIGMIILYLTGWFKRKVGNGILNGKLSDMTFVNKYICIPCTLFVVIFCLAFGKHLIGNSAGYLCYDFISTGRLNDFRNQMKERIDILESDEKIIILPQMSDDQGPFMHMPIVENPDGYANYATKLFYFKDSVIAIPRNEWNELYGG